MAPAIVKHILVISLSNIGDVVMTTPVLQALHAQYPEAVIDIVGDQRSDCLFEHLPYLGRLIRKTKRASFKQSLHFICQLRQVPYDIAVDLRTDGVLYLIRAKHKYHKRPNRETLNMHSVEKHFAALAPIASLTNRSIPAAHIALTQQHRDQAQQFYLDNQLLSQPVLALGLGANFHGKIWPAAKYAQLANLLKANFPNVLLLGNAQDAALAQAFKTQLGESDLTVIDACGAFDLLSTTALLQAASYFVGNDSGLGHLASAVGVPSFTVFGVGQPHRYRPWGEQALWYQDANENIEQVDSALIAQKIQTYLSSAG